MSEPSAVAGAAAFHCQDWRYEPPFAHDYYPGVEWTLAFVDTYLRARGAPWTDAEAALFRASLIYRLAYQARCGHALDPHSIGPAERRLDEFAAAFWGTWK